MPSPLAVNAPVHGVEATAFRKHWIEAIRRRFTNDANRIALRSSEGMMTYAELGDKVAGLAAMLRERGIGKQDRIGVSLHRGFDLIVSLLAIIECGASYIPIDPGYPPERIRQMIASAGLKRMLTNRAFPFDADGVDILRCEDAAGDSHRSGECPGASDVMYAIFTSGSTGQPKAAAVFHSGFANLLDWYVDELSLGPDDRTLAISSPSFDLTQKNLFAPLITGGTLILDDAETYDITRITGLIRDHGVTAINCTPSAFYPLVDAAGDGFAALSSLRFAVLGGEPISVPRLKAWLEHPSCKAEVVNSYGPTECTDICLFHRLHRENLDLFPFVPLGRGIPNVQVTIRDENLAPLKDDMVGELCIAGIGLGAGYLNDPARTAERFVNGIYRSGDLARRLPCGTFEFRGRADHQVKVNGHRIEPGEIEIALGAHGSVTEAVVIAGESGLVAHVKGAANAATLREHLASRLPAYMVPARFVFMDDFPLTPNGKVDRKALMAQASAEAVAASPPSDGLEGKVLAIWSDLLGNTVTDPLANFFDLGGDSIQLAVMHVRLRDLIGRDFPITDLFAMPTARAISLHLQNEGRSTATHAARDRARLAKAGFSRFKRPASR
jgi:amino acid adenylation domain-containing protein